MWIRLRYDEMCTVAHYLGVLVLGLSVAMIVPFATGLALGEWDPALDYLIGIGVALAIGSVLRSATCHPQDMGHRQALLVAALAWIVSAGVAAVPLSLSGNYGSYIDALFDAVSGFTTSGLTLAQDLDHMASAHNMWRHLTHLVGGQGIIVAAVSLAIGLKGGAFSLYLAEGRDERILPNVVHTARFIWFVTAIWVTLGTVALTISNVVSGMVPHRGLLHAFWLTIAAYDTGGFGPQSQNALYYHSPVFEFITAMLMLAGTLNFNLHADLWRGDPKEIFKNLEAKTLAFNLFVLTAFAAVGAATSTYMSGTSEVIRKAAYHIISANSGTGHQTVYASQWSQLGPAGFYAIILAMSFGGMVSSTAGGIKSLRIGLIVKGAVNEVRRQLSPPSAVVRARYHHLVDRILTPETLSTALMIFVLYIVTYLTGGLIGAAYGYPLGDALFESVSATANVGMSTGITAPSMPLGLKIVYILQMWAGRLEFFTLFTLFALIIVSVTPRRRPA